MTSLPLSPAVGNDLWSISSIFKAFLEVSSAPGGFTVITIVPLVSVWEFSKHICIFLRTFVFTLLCERLLLWCCLIHCLYSCGQKHCFILLWIRFDFKDCFRTASEPLPPPFHFPPNLSLKYTFCSSPRSCPCKSVNEDSSHKFSIRWTGTFVFSCLHIFPYSIICILCFCYILFANMFFIAYMWGWLLEWLCVLFELIFCGLSSFFLWLDLLFIHLLFLVCILAFICSIWYVHEH